MLSSVFAASHVQKAHDAQDVRAPLAHNDYPLPHRRPVRPLVMRHAQPASAACRNGCNYACTLGCRYVLLPERPNAKSPAFGGDWRANGCSGGAHNPRATGCHLALFRPRLEYLHVGGALDSIRKRRREIRIGSHQ